MSQMDTHSLSKLNKSNNVSSGIIQSFRVPVFALKSPTIAECIFESFDNAINSFSISSNDSELEYLVIIYKSKLENCLSFIHSESQFVQWVKISNITFDLQNDIILGCVYVPPEGSKYSNSESFDEIEKELIPDFPNFHNLTYMTKHRYHYLNKINLITFHQV
jgi:hypothetical protein